METEQRNEIHQFEQKLDIRAGDKPQVQRLVQDLAKPNPFEAQPDNREEYQKRIEELRQQERDRQLAAEYQTYKTDLMKTLPLRMPAGEFGSAQARLIHRLNDLYEPISKERNRELLAALDEGIKRMDTKTDEKPFVQLFGEYVLRYQRFVGDMLAYSDARAGQAETLQDIQQMLAAANGRVW